MLASGFRAEVYRRQAGTSGTGRDGTIRAAATSVVSGTAATMPMLPTSARITSTATTSLLRTETGDWPPSANRSRSGVIGRAMRVGRSHIAATVNTLVLAYLGAGLPLLLLFALSGQSPLLVLNGEVVAVEAIRALVGSVGIVAAVPLTTLVAAALMVPARPVPDVTA